MKTLSLIFFLLSLSYITLAQTYLNEEMVEGYLQSVNKRISKAGNSIDRSADKYLNKVRKIEQRLEGKKAIVINKAGEIRRSPLGLENYNSEVDSLRTTLSFLSLNKNGISEELLGQHSKTLEYFEDKLQFGEDIDNHLKTKIDGIKNLLIDNIDDKGVLKDLKKLNKVKYYYTQQMNEYRSMLSDKTKAEARLLKTLRETDVFKDFFRKHSWLNQIFPAPPAENGIVDLSAFGNLQTRSQLSEILGPQLSQLGNNELSAQMQEVQNNFSDIQSRVFNGEGDMVEGLPAFKPNSQKTKSFFQRLEFSFNIQNNRASGFYPTHSNISTGAGYKFSDNNITGIALNYQLGWGELFDKIRLTTQGLGWISYTEWKLKGNFWLYASYESNRKLNVPDSVSLSSLTYNSAYAGISKRINVKTQFFKAMKFQLLFDFLARHQYPPRQYLNFRISFVR